MKNLLPEKLTALRKNLQLSQGDLAQRLDVPVSEYMNWENGNTICNNVPQLKEMVDIFGVSVQDLADNTKTLTLPRTDTHQDSVQIPFMNTHQRIPHGREYGYRYCAEHREKTGNCDHHADGRQ